MEQVRDSIVVNVEEPTQVAAARRAAADLCHRLQLPQETAADAELIAVELANNLLQHAGSGQLFFTPHSIPGSIEILSIDRGPGIPSVQRALTDGYTSRNTPGLGLGAIQRKARHFDLFSVLGKGTVAAALIGPPLARHEVAPWDTSVLSVPLRGELANGDAWAIHIGPTSTTFLLADGLGHGPYASEASSLARTIFLRELERDPNLSLTELIELFHPPLRATRGAAISLFAVNRSNLTGIGCGVGNVSCLLQSPDGNTRSLASHNGTVGHQMRRLQEFPFTLAPGTLLILHSDGLSTHWKLAQYPGLDHAAPALIAATLFRDAARPRDDATVLVTRLHPAADPHPEPVHG